MARNKVAEKSVDMETLAVMFAFVNGETITAELGKMSKGIQEALGLHGLKQKIGDSYAGAKSVEDAVEAAGTVLERLMNGDWVKERESAGPRPSMVVNAVIAALMADGQEIGEDRLKRITETVKTAEGRQQAMNNPIIKAQYETLRAQAAAERAHEAAEAATEAEDVSLGDF